MQGETAHLVIEHAKDMATALAKALGAQFGPVWEVIGPPLAHSLTRRSAPDYERNTAAEAIGEVVTHMVGASPAAMVDEAT